MSQKTIAEREKLVNDVEDLMLRGINRPTTICRMVSGIGNRQTAVRYIDAVIARWRNRNGVDNEVHRQRLLAETQEIHSRAFSIVARVSNLETQTPASASAAATALGVALKALERQAKLLGLDSERRVVDAGPEALDALRESKSLGFDRPNALVDLYALLTGPPPGPDLHAAPNTQHETDFGLMTTVEL
jgi:hypothetical protein